MCITGVPAWTKDLPPEKAVKGWRTWDSIKNNLDGSPELRPVHARTAVKAWAPQVKEYVTQSPRRGGDIGYHAHAHATQIFSSTWGLGWSHAVAGVIKGYGVVAMNKEHTSAKKVGFRCSKAKIVALIVGATEFAYDQDFARKLSKRYKGVVVYNVVAREKYGTGVGWHYARYTRSIVAYLDGVRIPGSAESLSNFLKRTAKKR